MLKTRKNNHIYVPEDPPTGPSLWVILILLFAAPPISSIIGVYLAVKRGKREWTRKQYKEFRRYANMIGNRGSVSLRELASRLGKSTSDVMTELQAMIDQGIIGGEAYIDRSTMMLYLDVDETETETGPTINIHINPELRAEDGTQTVRPYQPQQQAAPQPQPQPQRTQQTQQPQPQKAEPAKKAATTPTDSEFEDKLRQIRELNDAIEDKTVSDRIDRIGALTASIFRVVKEKPERADEVRKFMNYYLPTTFKLLKSYSLMEKQSYQGENIVASRKKIEDILDTLIHAFEQQQDRLFQTEALDVETDISVLETMMASDGLLENKGLRLRASGSGEE